MNRSSPHPGYHHIGGNVFVAKVNTPGNQDRARARPKPAPGTSEDLIKALCDARTEAVTSKGAPGTMQATMRAQLERDGLKPVTDPGAGLSPARASMARILAADGMKPAA